MALQLDEARIAEIVERVMARLGGAGPTAAPAPPPGRIAESSGAARIPRASNGVYSDPEAAVQAARRGFEANERAPVALRAKMIAAMREVTARHLKELANYAVEESGIGRVEDKIGKNRLVMEKTPGIEILRPVAFTG
ncbi:MAG TPA: aldehyde dehydrogenase EutE, partial [Kofleriaceae bacterium]|nr:aldehyde dehydrogenase EutE [Kofleriaceae bacterium]